MFGPQILDASTQDGLNMLNELDNEMNDML